MPASRIQQKINITKGNWAKFIKNEVINSNEQSLSFLKS
jgi:hypothetical protein